MIEYIKLYQSAIVIQPLSLVMNDLLPFAIIVPYPALQGTNVRIATSCNGYQRALKSLFNSSRQHTPRVES